MKKLLFIILLFMLWGGYLYSAIDAESLFEQGMEAFKSGNWGSSELLFKKIIDSGEDDYKDEAKYYLARSIFHRGKYKAAIFEFNDYINDCNSAELCIEARFWIGESYYHQDEYNKAINIYNRYIRKTKKGALVAIAYDRIGSIYFAQKRYDEAEIEWKKAISNSKNKIDNARRLLNIGDSLFRNGKYDESLKRINPLLTAEIDKKITARARLITGRVLQKQEKHKKALIIFKGIPNHLFKEYPYNEVQYFKAISNIKLKDFSTAKSQLNLFLLIAKKSEWYYHGVYELGKIFVETRKKKKGLMLLEEAAQLSRDPGLKAKALKILSEVYLVKSPEKAIPYMEKSYKLAPENDKKEITLALGKAYLKARRFKESAKFFDLFIKLYPYDNNIDSVQFQRARIALETGENDKAMKLFKSLKDENPFAKYIDETNYYLGLVKYQKKEYAASISLLKKYLRIRKIENRFDALLLIVNSYISLNDIKRSGRYLNIILKKYIKKKDVDKITFRYILALRKASKNPWKYYNVIIKNFPETDEAASLYFEVGNQFFTKKKYKKAIDYYDRFISAKVKADKGQAYFNRLISLFNLKKYKDVIGTIRKGHIPQLEEKQWKEMPLLLSRSYYNLGNYEKVYGILADSDLKEYGEKDLLMFAKSALKMGDIKTVKMVSKQLERKKKYFGNILFLLGQYYKEKEDYDEAMGFFSRILFECPGTEFVSPATLEAGDIYILKRKYKSSIEKLSSVKGRKYLLQKNYLLIKSYFLSKEARKAVRITRRYFNKLRRSKYAEEVIRLNVNYYYKSGNLKGFLKYSRYLKKYKENVPFINYFSGMIYYNKKKYRKAYSYFYKLTLNDMTVFNGPEKVASIRMINEIAEKVSLNLFKTRNKIVVGDSVFIRVKNLAVILKILEIKDSVAECEIPEKHIKLFRKIKLDMPVYKFNKNINKKVSFIYPVEKYYVQSFYYLGNISNLVTRKKKLAIKFYNKFLEFRCDNDEFRKNAIINIAIMHREMKEMNLSKKYLLQIINGRKRDLAYYRAKNLYEKFGFMHQ